MEKIISSDIASMCHSLSPTSPAIGICNSEEQLVGVLLKKEEYQLLLAISQLALDTDRYLDSVKQHTESNMHASLNFDEFLQSITDKNELSAGS
ncbi:hypothetical protein DXX93_10380 [Thalassotalea euphylliae]|uniref:Uncharacterized protein n=1 Tax=Thalassotalea euphylliae TaxID=1655234 RepID=A0A3E0TSN1_9GAMM|nr:hypothetical protein [Thalassotalea euphylliae]REL26935.1 hypothetical protein DXX93_10380 [Thalassotalea euphylliae]